MHSKVVARCEKAGEEAEDHLQEVERLRGRVAELECEAAAEEEEELELEEEEEELTEEEETRQSKLV